VSGEDTIAASRSRINVSFFCQSLKTEQLWQNNSPPPSNTAFMTDRFREGSTDVSPSLPVDFASRGEAKRHCGEDRAAEPTPSAYAGVREDEQTHERIFCPVCLGQSLLETCIPHGHLKIKSCSRRSKSAIERPIYLV
jgi:hypothetical protein